MFENNEKDMLGLQDILVDILYIVVDIICDWNAWLQSLPKKKMHTITFNLWKWKKNKLCVI
jgi:hypothetical protein